MQNFKVEFKDVDSDSEWCLDVLLALVTFVEVVEDAEEIKEEVDDVEVEGDGGVDVFLRRHLK